MRRLGEGARERERGIPDWAVLVEERAATPRLCGAAA